MNMIQINKNETPSLTRSMIWLMAVGSGLVVANLYYNQPLLGLIARNLQQTEAAVSKIPMITQLGYATGLLFIVPLGDMFKRKRIILIDFALILLSLLAFALSSSLTAMLVASFFIGITSVVPQIFIPLAAQLSRPKDTAKNVAMVVSGILIGILASRVFSGMVGEYLGWRMVYFIAMGGVLLLGIFIAILLPEMNPTFSGTYRELMKSILYYVKIFPELRMAAVRGALTFASFSIFWTTLVFHLESPPFFAGSDIAGLLGLVGIVGALAASITGRITQTVGQNLVITVGGVLMLLSWLVFGVAGASYCGLIIGIVFLDMGIQAINVSNQSIIFSAHRNATNRINTAYMVTYFIGGAIGTWIGGWIWQIAGWAGVVTAGTFIVFSALLIHLLSIKRIKN